MNNTVKRIFLAAHIESDFINLELLSDLKSSLSHEKINWTKTDQTHITLKFFGDTKVELIKEIDNKLNEAIKNHTSFEIHFRKLGVFGSSYNPKVLWLNFEDDNNFKNIFEDVQKNLEKINIFGDRQNFVPHLTLGRIKKLTDKKIFQKIIDDYSMIKSQSSKINELTLYESILSTKGATHIALHTYKLK